MANFDGTDTDKAKEVAATPWKMLSWKNADCCQKLVEDKVWEDVETGVPDCFCRCVGMCQDAWREQLRYSHCLKVHRMYDTVATSVVDASRRQDPRKVGGKEIPRVVY